MDSITPDKSLFEKILAGIDKPDAVMRAAIGDVLLGDKSVPSARQILSGKKTYDIDSLKKALERKTGIRLQAGDYDADNPWYQDVTNFVADTTLNIGLSPTNYVGGFIPKLGKALLGTKGAGLATGATLGALTGDSPVESLTNAAIGAASLGLGAPALGTVAKGVAKTGADIIDTQMRGAFPKVFEGTELGYSKAFDIANRDKKLFESVGRKMREYDTKLGLYDLGPEDSAILDEYMRSTSSQWTAHRNKLTTQALESEFGIKPLNIKGDSNVHLFATAGKNGKAGDRYIADMTNSTVTKIDASGKPVATAKFKGSYNGALKRLGGGDAVRFDDLSTPEARELITTAKGGGRIRNFKVDELNSLSEMTNNYIGGLVREELATIDNPMLTQNVAKFVDRNRKFIEAYNTANKGREGFERIVPIDFHTFRAFVPDAEKLKRGADQYKGIKSGFMKLTSEKLDEVPLTLQERLKRESEQAYKNYLDKTGKEAAKIVSGVRYSRTADDAGYINKFINKFDDFTSFLKQQQLTFSHSWIVNNFTENIVKAYMSGGANNAAEVLANQGRAILRNSDGMMSDLLKLTDPSSAKAIGLKYDVPAVSKALDYGVVSEDFFSEAFKPHMSEAYLATRVGKDEAKKIIERGEIGGLAKVKENYSEFLRNTVGRTGSLIEQSARITTFKNVADDLLDNADVLGFSISPEYKALVRKVGILEAPVTPELDAVLRKASQITNETFFDYGNVSAFEQEVMKRLFPYWTFFSRNIPYWLENVGTSPDRVANVLSVYKSLGDEPTREQRNVMPDYLLDRGARITEGGATVTAPSLSMVDALNALDWRRSALDKFHPVINTVANLVSKKTNLGANLYPSEAKSGKVKVMGPGDLMAELLPSATYRDEYGDRQTTSDLFSLVSMLKGSLLPTPALDTAARIVEGVRKGSTLGQELQNLGPVKQKVITPDEASRTIDYRMSDLERRLRNQLNNR